MMLKFIAQTFFLLCAFSVGNSFMIENCPVSTNFKDIDTSSITSKCIFSPQTVNFCSSCVCGISQDVANMIFQNIPSLHSNHHHRHHHYVTHNLKDFCDAPLHTQIPSCVPGYISYLVEKNILTDQIFNCAPNVNFGDCGAWYAEAQNKYKKLCEDDPAPIDVSPSPSVSISPAPIDESPSPSVSISPSPIDESPSPSGSSSPSNGQIMNQFGLGILSVSLLGIMLM